MANLVLEWLDPSGTPHRVAVNRPLTIGRSPENDIVLDSPQVSRHHCTIAPTPQGIAIGASMSTNGVLIDGRRVNGGGVGVGGAFLVGGVSIGVTQGAAEAPPGVRSLPALAAIGAAGVGVLVLAVVLAVAGPSAEGGDSLDRLNPILPSTVTADNAADLFVALGGPPGDSPELTQARQMIAAAQGPLHLEKVGQAETVETHEGMRIDRQTYRVSGEGQPESRSINVERVQVQDDNGNWRTLSTIVNDVQ